jgi:hypothetical protein
MTIRVSTSLCMLHSLVMIRHPKCHVAIWKLSFVFWYPWIKNLLLVRSDVLTVLLLIVQVFRDVILCHWVSSSWSFEGSFSVKHLSWAVQEDCLTQKIKALWSFRMSETVLVTQCHIQNVRNCAGDTASHSKCPH